MPLLPIQIPVTTDKRVSNSGKHDVVDDDSFVGVVFQQWISGGVGAVLLIHKIERVDSRSHGNSRCFERSPRIARLKDRTFHTTERIDKDAEEVTGIGVDLSADYLRLANWRVFESGHAAKTMRRTNQERQGSLL